MGLKTLFGIAAMCLGGASAHAGGPSAQPPKNLIQTGGNIFKSHCILCHGLDATGSTNLGEQLKARNLHSPEVQQKSAAEIKHIITEGKGANMPAFAPQLSSEQIEEVAAYVKQLKALKK